MRPALATSHDIALMHFTHNAPFDMYTLAGAANDATLHN
jgi:hypothetical protein